MSQNAKKRSAWFALLIAALLLLLALGVWLLVLGLTTPPFATPARILM